MIEAKERIQAGEDRETVMAEVLAEFGIDIEELKAKFAENTDGKRSFKRGFRGRHGFPGIRGFGTPALPSE